MTDLKNRQTSFCSWNKYTLIRYRFSYNDVKIKKITKTPIAKQASKR